MQRHHVVGLMLAFLVASGQFLAVSSASAQSSGAPGAGIFIPKPRGSEDSLDPNAVAQTGTTVTGRDGDRLTGSVNSIANGVLRFSGPFFDSEVGIFTAAIRDIQFPARGGAENGRDLVVLTNDDRIFGTIQGMTPADVAFESAKLGFLKISNRCIKRMEFQGGTDVQTRTDFAGGRPSPLQIAGSGWQITGGTLRIGPPSTATLPLDQNGAVTVVLEFARMGQAWNLSLFADQPGRDVGDMPMNNRGRGAAGGAFAFAVDGNALSLALTQRGYSIIAWKYQGQPTSVVSSKALTPAEVQEIRFAYDPATSDVKLWVNGQVASEAKAPAGPKQGKYVVFSPQDFSDLKSLAVLDGVQGPAKADDEADPNNETIVCRSGERMHAETIALADGVFTVKTTFSDKPLSVPAAKVASIIMSKAGRETPPPPEHPAQVALPKSLITVELIELTGKTATAKSPYLGEIQIERDAIRSLRFLTTAN